MTQNQNSSFPFLQSAGETEEIKSLAADNRHAEIRISLRIPQQYREEPVISRLISDYHLNVNVKAALLAANDSTDGWFDLELQGTNSQIKKALAYLSQIDVQIWNQLTDPDEENW